MSYTKHNFVSGDTLLASDLNAMEDQIAANEQTGLDLKSAVNDPVTGLETKAPVIIDTASGAIASFDDGADGMLIKSLTVNIEPVQSGSGDPSPTNVRPISGWTGCNIHVSRTTSGGTVYPITFPASAGTVYGGTLSGTTGVMTVDRATLDLSTKTWNWNGANNWWTTTLPDAKKPQDEQAANILCSNSKTVAATAVRSESATCIALNSNKTLIYKNFDSANSPAGQLVYELATPIEITLTPTQIETLRGTNNVWADCGPVSVEYPVDTQSAIDTQAADISDIKSAFDSNKNKHFNLVWEHGDISTEGADSAYHANSRIRTVGILKITDPVRVSAINSEDTSAFVIAYYDKNGNHIKNSSAWLKDEILRPGENIRITMSLTPSNNTAADIDTILDGFNVGEYLIEPTNLYTSAYENKLLSLKRNFDKSATVPCGSRNTSNNSFAIAHISDLHTDATRLDFFVKFCKYYQKYLDAKICTGDYVNSPVTEEINHMKDYGIDNNILFCVGNHERGGFNSSSMSLADVYTSWDVATIQTNNNAVTDGESLYYYVDYVKTGVGGYKIRLIVLNNISQTNNSKVNTYTPEEITWLIDVLKDSATNGYSVLLASHYDESDIIDNDKGFYCVDSVVSGEHAFTPVVENIINAFRNSARYQLNKAFVRDNTDEYLLTFDADFTSYPNGSFLAWMVGHFHTDRIGYSASNPDMLYLSVACGALESDFYPTGTDMSRFNDIPRVKGTETENAFNVYSFDVENNLCKVLRVGSNLNYEMTPRDIACFDTSPTIPYAITRQPADVLAPAKAQVNYSITAPGTKSYSWEYSTDGGNTWRSANNTTAGISFTMSAAYTGRMYRCTVSNGETSITSRAALLTVAT